MKFGVREICDVVLRAKSTIKIGTMTFYKDMPVFYFDSLKTSSLESAATTVYAQGGKGNTRLIAWEGEKTLTFTMEDALISAITLSMLSGAQVINKATEGTIVHATEVIELEEGKTELTYKPTDNADFSTYLIPLDENGDISGQPLLTTVNFTGTTGTGPYTVSVADIDDGKYLIDYYYNTNKKVTQFNITPDKFAGNYYLEASTLFRNKDGVDLPAEFIIPNCKIQSNFTFSMASSGDPSTFTFTMDAFPDYTKYDKTTKVLAAIQILEEADAEDDGGSASAGATITYPAAAASSYKQKTTKISDEI